MQKRSYLHTHEAALIAGVCHRTIFNWCQKQPGLAVQIAGFRWRIDPGALAKLVQGTPGGMSKKAARTSAV